MCSSTLSDPVNRLRKTRKKKSSAVPLISERSHIGNLRQIKKQGKGRCSKRKENRRLSFLFAPAAGRGTVPAVRRRRIPPLRFSGKLPARQGRTRLRQFACPGQPVQKRSRPPGANPPAAVRVPRSAGAEKEPPVRCEPACGSSCARSPCAEKAKAPQNCFHGAQSMHFYSNRSSVSTSLRAGACGSCAG